MLLRLFVLGGAGFLLLSWLVMLQSFTASVLPLFLVLSLVLVLSAWMIFFCRLD